MSAVLPVARLGGLLLLLSLLWGCAGAPQTARLLKTPPPALQTATELNQVPFYPQEEYQCGPAALATVLNFQHIEATPQHLSRQVFIPGKQGSLQLELLSATRQYSLIPYVISPRLDDLLHHVKNGQPVLVFQNLALDWYPQWHYAVVVGFDLARDEIILRSGRDRRRINSLAQFERTWQRAGYWGLLLLQPGQLPDPVEYWRYLQAVASMESVGQFAAAVKGYSAGLTNWPDDIRLLMGRANSHFALQHYQLAEQDYQRVIGIDARYAAAYNNLAELKFRTGQLNAAQRYARRAVSLGGAHAELYRQTLQDIQNAISTTP